MQKTSSTSALTCVGTTDLATISANVKGYLYCSVYYIKSLKMVIQAQVLFNPSVLRYVHGCDYSFWINGHDNRFIERTIQQTMVRAPLESLCLCSCSAWHNTRNENRKELDSCSTPSSSWKSKVLMLRSAKNPCEMLRLCLIYG